MNIFLCELEGSKKYYKLCYNKVGKLYDIKPINLTSMLELFKNFNVLGSKQPIINYWIDNCDRRIISNDAMMKIKFIPPFTEGVIYLIYPFEFRMTNDNIYKIGFSSRTINRRRI